MSRPVAPPQLRSEGPLLWRAGKRDGFHWDAVGGAEIGRRI